MRVYLRLQVRPILLEGLALSIGYKICNPICVFIIYGGRKIPEDGCNIFKLPSS